MAREDRPSAEGFATGGELRRDELLPNQPDAPADAPTYYPPGREAKKDGRRLIFIATVLAVVVVTAIVIVWALA